MVGSLGLYCILGICFALTGFLESQGYQECRAHPAAAAAQPAAAALCNRSNRPSDLLGHTWHAGDVPADVNDHSDDPAGPDARVRSRTEARDGRHPNDDASDGKQRLPVMPASCLGNCLMWANTHGLSNRCGCCYCRHCCCCYC